MASPQDEKEIALMKQAFREAADEWLNKQAQKFGWFSAAAIGCAALAGVFYFILWSSGWHK